MSLHLIYSHVLFIITLTLAVEIDVMTRSLFFSTLDMICDILKTHFRGYLWMNEWEIFKDIY